MAFVDNAQEIDHSFILMTAHANIRDCHLPSLSLLTSHLDGSQLNLRMFLINCQSSI
jgi:hypothetical protein